MSSPYDEPKGGDYVAYLAQLEQRQMIELSKAKIDIALALNAAGTAAAETSARSRPVAKPTSDNFSQTSPAPDASRPPLSAGQAQQIADLLKGQAAKPSSAAAQALVPGIIGLVLLLIGLAIDRGWLFILIGAYLIYRMIRALARRPETIVSAAAQVAEQVGHVFGSKQKPR